jgi:hypothetical protein
MLVKLRDVLKNLIFQFKTNDARQLRPWALVAITVYLGAIWKTLIELDQVVPNEFWMAVLGRDPMGDLGPSGFLLLTLYSFGAAIWFFITMLLVQFTSECARRLGISS